MKKPPSSNRNDRDSASNAAPDTPAAYAPELLRLNRALRMISECSQALVRATDEQTLLQNVCTLVVEQGGYRMAWVGYAEQNGRKSVRCVAHAGHSDGYVEGLDITWDESKRGRGPTGTAIRTGKLATARDMTDDASFGPWRKEALKRGYRSSIVLPLKSVEGVFGAISIYSEDAGAFDRDEERLLADLADDLAYGISALRERQARANAEELLRRAIESLERIVTERTAELSESENRYRTLFDNMLDGYAYCQMLYDDRGDAVDFVYLDVNSAFGKLTGLKKVKGKKVSEVIPGIRQSDPALFELYGRVVKSGRPAKFEMELNSLDMWFSVSVYAVPEQRFVAVFENITERRRSELTLHSAHEELLTANEQLQEEIHERTRIESSLRETRDYLENLFNYANAPIICWDQDLKITRFNHAFERLTGYPAAEVLSKRLDILFPDATAQISLEEINRTLIGERWESVEIPILRRDGEVRTALWNSANVYAEDGTTITATIAQGVDITVRKQAQAELARRAEELDLLNNQLEENNAQLEEEIRDRMKAEEKAHRHAEELDHLNHELEEANAQLEEEIRDRVAAEERIAYQAHILESVHDAILSLDADWRILSWNDAAETLYGWKAEEVIGRTSEEVIQTEISPAERADIIRLLGEAGTLSGEFVQRRKNGEPIHVDVSTVALRDEHGRVTGYVTANRDISRRKKAEAELQRSQQQFRSLADAIPQLAWFADGDGYIRWYNKRWYEYTGTTPRQMEGWGWQSVHDPEALPAVMEKWQESIATGSPFNMIFPLRGADGVFRPFLTRVEPVKDADGKVVQWFGTNTDVDELKRAEEALREKAALLDLARDSIVVRSIDRRILFWSRGGEAMYGYTAEEAVGKCIPELLKAEFVHRNIDEIDRIVLEKGYHQDEIIHHHKDGHVLNVDVQWSLLRDASGHPQSILQINRDITARKQAEAAIRIGSRRFEILANTSGELLRAERPQAMIESLCKDVMQHLDCQVFFNFLADRAVGRLHLNAYAGIPEEDGRKLEWLNYGQAICGRVAQRGRRIIAQHIPTTDEPGAETVRNIGVKAYCCHPLLGAEGQVLGTLSFGTRTRETFTHDEVAMMKAVSDHVSVALTRIKAQEALEESETRFRTLFSEMQSGAALHEIILDEQGTPVDYRFLDINPAFERQTGLKRDQVVGKRLLEVLPESEPFWIETYGKVALTGEPIRFENVHRTLGKHYDCIAYRPRPGQFAVIFNDVTDRKRAEVALRETKDFLENLITYANAPIIVWNPKFEITTFNHAFERLTGRTAAEALGQKLDILFPEESRDRSFGYIRQAVAGERWETVEIPILHRDGSVRTVLWNSATLFGEDGRAPVATIAQGQDITERKLAEAEVVRRVQELDDLNNQLEENNAQLEEEVRDRMYAEEQVRRYNEQLERLVQERTAKIQKLERERLESEKQVAMGRMAARIAHEINNPLTGIKNSFTLVKRAIPTDFRYYEFVGTIDRELNRIARIVRQMFELYRPEHVEADQISPSDAIRDVVVLLEGNVRSSQVTLELNTANAQENVVLHEDTLKQVLFSIAQNAIEASPPGGRVVIGAEVADARLVVKVTDQGSGIPEELRSKIFEPFFTTKEGLATGGLGLGLSVTRGLMDASGGSLSFESVPGSGTIFTLVFPIQSRQTENPHA
jgi:PAS domain S-box-containing protein